jgi:dynactin 1
MEALKTEIASLQAAVRYLREDNRRARLTDERGLDWLQAPLIKLKTKEQQRKALVLSEGDDVLNELLNLAKNASIYDLSTMPKNRLAWRPAKSTPQYHVAKQREDYEAWSSWKDVVVRKARVLEERDANSRIDRRPRGNMAAKVQMRLPDLEGKGIRAGGKVEIVESNDFEGFRNKLGFV